jgi:hypothetical protein
MAKTHIVKQGEHLSGIAAENGFGDFHVIWDHPSNAALKAKRDPHVLFPGDKLFIPDRQEKTEQRPTTQVHLFEVFLLPLFLRLRVLDIDAKPVVSTPCLLGLEEAELQSKTTDGKAIVEEEIEKLVKNGELHIERKKKPPKKDAAAEIEKIKFDLKIGSLNPHTTLSGQQARLNNLGYFAGFTVNDHAQFSWAIEEFQCDHMSKPVKQTPEIVPESEDPNAITGVKNQAVANKLRDVHGI